jgi:hypothetical protein
MDKRKIKYDKNLEAYVYITNDRLWIKQNNIIKIYKYNEYLQDFVGDTGEFFVRCNAIGDKETSDIVLALMKKQQKKI